MAKATKRTETESIPDSAKEIEEALSTFGVIKSATHGRIRLQLRPEYRAPEVMASLKAQLEKDKRVDEVTINERTGSVIVKYIAEYPSHGHSLLWKAVQEVELVGEIAFDLEPTEDEEEPGEKDGGGGTYGKLDQQVADLMYKIDGAIYRRTDGKIHVRGRVLPLTLAGLGVVQMAIYGIGLELIPGPLLIWLAHDIHVRFSKEPPMLVVPEPGEAIDQRGQVAAAGKPSPATGAVALSPA
jgi:hypothetical protein